MADQKISQLPSADALDGSEKIPLEQGGATKQIPSDTYQRRSVVDARTEGAVLDGSTDDQSAIQTALNNHDHVIVAEGDAFIGSSLSIPSDTVLEIAPNASVTVPAGFTGSMFRFDASGGPVLRARVLAFGRLKEAATQTQDWNAVEFNGDTNGISHCLFVAWHVDKPHTLFRLAQDNGGFIIDNFAVGVFCQHPIQVWYYTHEVGMNNSYLSRNTFERVDVQGNVDTNWTIRDDPGWANEYLGCRVFDATNSSSNITSNAADTLILGGYGLARWGFTDNSGTATIIQDTTQVLQWDHATQHEPGGTDFVSYKLGADAHSIDSGPSSWPEGQSVMYVSSSNGGTRPVGQDGVVWTARAGNAIHQQWFPFNEAVDLLYVRSYDNSAGVWLGWQKVAAGNAGTSAFSGDGSTTTFSIAHGLGSIPTSRAVWAESADAAGDKYVSNVDATNIDVTFATAPASGTDNVVLGFDARL